MEKEELHLGLRFKQRHIVVAISPETRKQLRMPDDLDESDYIVELKAHIMEILTWATISFL
jgi:hypothetical protein